MHPIKVKIWCGVHDSCTFEDDAANALTVNDKIYW